MGHEKGLYDTYFELFVLVGDGPVPKTTKEEARRLIADFVIQTSQPIAVVENPAFKKLVEGLSDGGHTSITRKTFVSDLDKMFTEHIKIVSLKMEQHQFVCTTADIWSNKKRSFLGVSHFNIS